jgi:ubiquinone/menaquinone biosynthesis C-methylase UbiE
MLLLCCHCCCCFYQTRLVRQAMALGCLQPGQHVLDVVCGRGKSSYMMSCSVGSSGSVLGVDLLAQVCGVFRAWPGRVIIRIAA